MISRCADKRYSALFNLPYNRCPILCCRLYAALWWIRQSIAQLRDLLVGETGKIELALDTPLADLLLGRLGGVLVRPFASLERHRLGRVRKSRPCFHKDIHDPQVQILCDLEIISR